MPFPLSLRNRNGINQGGLCFKIVDGMWANPVVQWMSFSSYHRKRPAEFTESKKSRLGITWISQTVTVNTQVNTDTLILEKIIPKNAVDLWKNVGSQRDKWRTSCKITVPTEKGDREGSFRKRITQAWTKWGSFSSSTDRSLFRCCCVLSMKVN